MCERLLAFGVLSKDTHETVVRFAPPLTISDGKIDEALRSIGDAFATRATRQVMTADGK